MSRKRRGIKGRRVAKRATGDTVLIVCEGEKTEPIYLKALKEHLKLSTTFVEVVSPSGSAPSNVFKLAVEKLDEACRHGNPYAKVFCVIDKDNHSTYTKILDKIKRYTPPVECTTTLCAIPSVPCFEYWLLMHFSDSTASYGTTGGSACRALIDNALKSHLPDYTKSTSLVRLIEGCVQTAKRNAETTLRAAKSSGSCEPYTLMHRLVEDLEYLKINKVFKEDRKGCHDVCET